jgi:hypothetical protein
MCVRAGYVVVIIIVISEYNNSVTNELMSNVKHHRRWRYKCLLSIIH